jgi:hypothetical protein
MSAEIMTLLSVAIAFIIAGVALKVSAETGQMVLIEHLKADWTYRLPFHLRNNRYRGLSRPSYQLWVILYYFAKGIFIIALCGYYYILAGLIFVIRWIVNQRNCRRDNLRSCKVRRTLMCARKMDWFDDFMIMKMMEEDEKKNQPTPSPNFHTPNTSGYTGFCDEEEMSEEEKEERLEALNEELSNLESELFEVDLHEPTDGDSNAYERWERRRDLFQEQIEEVQAEIEALT